MESARLHMPSPESAPSGASRNATLGYAVSAAVLVGTYAFLLAMAYLEPITGDGWCASVDMARHGSSIGSLIARMKYYHVHNHPRLGQLFTFLAYADGPFHQLVTPLVLSAWSVLAVFHATGRWPALGSLRSAGLLLFAFAAAWLVLPAAGEALFYRPITTNYIYSVVLILAYFVPMRRDLRAQSFGRALGLAAVMLLGGVLVGMLNEHTGPALMLVAALSTALALRARRGPDAMWRGTATLGITLGFLFIFFAPGQAHRYGKLGSQSVFDTILDRGVAGTLELVGLMLQDVGPLLAAVVMLFAVYVATTKQQRAALAPRIQAGTAERNWPWVYVAVALAMFGTSLAAPMHIYRLFFAPSLLMAVGMIGIVDRMWDARAVRVAACGGALTVHVAFVALYLAAALEIHAADAQRAALLRAGGPEAVVVVPALPHARGDRYFFGDTARGDNRCRTCMATHYGVKAVKFERAKDKDKAKRKPKRRKPNPPAE
jgi:hypothetical protein